ncbi:hypothetical protein HF086_001480, partial [Spodoptera exigua]
FFLCLQLLQNLGKVDRTLDDIFEEHLQNFNRQHQQATRLQKEFNNYIRCIRAVQTASKSLMEAITEVYESGWSGHDLLYVQAQNLEMLWQDFSHKLGDQVLIPLNTYTNQFPEVRTNCEGIDNQKISDLGILDVSFIVFQVTKGREQLEEAKRTYEVLNSELHDELPALYDSRVLFYVNNLQTLFSAEQLFHSESHKVFGELEAITDKLANDCQRGSYSKKSNNVTMNNVAPPASPPALGTLNGKHTDTVQTPPSPAMNGSSPPPSPAEGDTPAAEVRAPPLPEPRSEESSKEKAPTPPAKREDKSPTPPVTNNNVEKEPADKKVEELYDIPVGSPVPPEKSNNNSEEKRQVDVEPKGEKGKENDSENKNDDVYDIPIGATLAGLPAGTLYRVRATYRYTREDSDELSFDVGEEEGWLMGIKESTNEKGMFPANFTRPI